MPDELTKSAVMSSGPTTDHPINASEVLYRHAAHDPTAVAVRTTDRSWSYGQVTSAVDRVRTVLIELGVVPGDRILLVCPTGPEFVIAYLAVLAHGAVAVTINPQCTARELGYFIVDSDARLCIAGGNAVGTTRQAAATVGSAFWALPEVLTSGPTGTHIEPRMTLTPLPARAPAVVLYTSGTTGQPKGAVLTHDNLVAAAATYVDLLTITKDDRLGTALPLFHVFGQVAVLLTSLRAQASVSLLNPFSGPALLAMASEHKLTIMSGVPTMWTEMLHADGDAARFDLAPLRLACSGGAALPLTVQQQFKSRFGAPILDGYGLSESTSAAAFNYPGRPIKEGSVGQALPGLEIAILDADLDPLPPGELGEIAIRGPVVMSGYWGRLAETTEAMSGDYLRTGDIGRLDEDGYLWVLDRQKDMIIRGGYNVYPREVEEQLHAHPAVREVAVIGIPDERLGEEVAAVIVLHRSDAATPAELRGWLSERLAAYKHPRLFQLVDELPKGSTGKILKRQIDRVEVDQRASRIRQQT